MGRSTLVFSCLVFLLHTGNVWVSGKRVITKNLMLSNGLDFGAFGIIDFCEDGSYTNEIEALFEDYSLLSTDETALNAIKLYCHTLDKTHTGYISSTIGTQGEWKGIRSCPSGFMTGMRAQVLSEQGTLGDDVAVQNVEMECDYGASTVLALDETTSSNIKPGEWGLWGRCDPGSAICGLEIRYEKTNLVLDTTAVSDMSMFCCLIDTPLTTEDPKPVDTTTGAVKTTTGAIKTTTGAIKTTTGAIKTTTGAIKTTTMATPTPLSDTH